MYGNKYSYHNKLSKPKQDVIERNNVSHIIRDKEYEANLKDS